MQTQACFSIKKDLPDYLTKDCNFHDNKQLKKDLETKVFPDLKKLDIGTASSIQKVETILTHVPNLEELHLNTVFSDYAMSENQPFSDSNKVKITPHNKIHTLYFSHCTGFLADFFPEFMKQILSALTNLRHLIIFGTMLEKIANQKDLKNNTVEIISCYFYSPDSYEKSYKEEFTKFTTDTERLNKLKSIFPKLKTIIIHTPRMSGPSEDIDIITFEETE